MNSPVVRWQIVSPDPEGTAQFYENVFGWTSTRDNAIGYRQVTAGEGGIHGGVWPGPPGVQPFVQLYVEVADIDACILRATELGAKVIVPKTVLPDGDAMAVLLDPGGMSVGVCTLKPGG
jgi:uncharacterized protein